MSTSATFKKSIAWDWEEKIARPHARICAVDASTLYIKSEKEEQNCFFRGSIFRKSKFVLPDIDMQQVKMRRENTSLCSMITLFNQF